MSTLTYPMRRALHLRLEAGLDDLDVASTLHGVAVDRLRCFELGEVELTPVELSELADRLSLHSSWHGGPDGLRELVGPDGSTYDLAADAAQAIGVIHDALTAEYERRLAAATEVLELEDGLPPATDPRWMGIAALWRPVGDGVVFTEATAQVARGADADVEPFLHRLADALKARRGS
jgi:hypothetical protein